MKFHARHLQRYRSNLFNFLIIFFLVSCGGGGGGSSPIPTITLSVSQSSVPLDSEVTINWSSQNTSSCQASGSWSGAKSTSGSELVTITLIGNNNFGISCSGDGGSQSSNVVVEGYRQLLGVTVDGYIRGAEIFIDENSNFIHDTSEYNTTSENNGEFKIRFNDGNLISYGGIDLDSGILLDNLMLVHSLQGFTDFKVISPLTTVSAFFLDPTLVKNSLGIDSSINIFTFDPVANKGDGSINDYVYEKNSQLTVIALSLSKLINSIRIDDQEDPVAISTRDAFNLIANEVESLFLQNDQKVDIESKLFLDSILYKAYEYVNVTPDITALRNSSILLSSLLPVIEVKDEDYLSTATFSFAIDTFQNDFQDAIDGSIQDSIVDIYSNNILFYIGNDQSVDSDLLAPQVNAFDNNGEIDEDNSITINVLSNDSFLSSAPVFIDVGLPNDGSALLDESLNIIYTPNQDFNGVDEFQYTISQGNKSSTATVTIVINPVNDAPEINIASTLQAPENQNFVDNISIYDVDGDDLILSFEGFDKDSFNLDSNNDLFFNAPPDYESKNIFYLVFSVTDGLLTETKEIEVLVTNVNDIEPVINTSSMIAREMCTLVGTIDGSDVEGDSLEWSISENDSVLFSIDKQSGLLSLNEFPRHNPDEDYNQQITLTVFDGVHEVSKEIPITLGYDPLYPHQWVLENTGQYNFAGLPGTDGSDANIMSMNCKYTGKGVVVSIIDEGLEIEHEDLAVNIVEGSFDWVEDDTDPTNTGLYGDHGTSVTGIIAMKGHNNIGGRGIAPDASLVGYNWLLAQTNAALFSSFNGLDGLVEVGVSNNSWGRGSSEWFMPPEYDSDTWDAISQITETSRSGKGTVFVKSNGNSWSIGGYCGPNQSNSDEMPCTTASSNSPVHAVPFFVGIPSLNADDERSSYSTPGSSSWISGYGGEFGYGPPNYLVEDYPGQERYFKSAIISTDQSGCDKGYVRTENDAGTPRNALSTGDHPLNLNCDYLPHMNGTSSAGPTVAGLVALLLEVNPEFTWRDIKHILANTASVIDEDRSKSLTFNNDEISMYSWIENSAGYNFHNWFGFGKLNISDAISYAENMTPNNLGEFITYELITAEDSDPNWDLTIADQKLTHSINLSTQDQSNGKVEWIRLRFWFDYPDMSDIGLRLTSPQGTTLNVLYPYGYKINNPKRLNTEYDFEEYYFDIGVAGFYGENISGDWTLEVINWESGGCPEETDDDGNVTSVCTTGTLENWGIIAYGN